MAIKKPKKDFINQKVIDKTSTESPSKAAFQKQFLEIETAKARREGREPPQLFEGEIRTAPEIADIQATVKRESDIETSLKNTNIKSLNEQQNANLIPDDIVKPLTLNNAAEDQTGQTLINPTDVTSPFQVSQPTLFPTSAVQEAQAQEDEKVKNAAIIGAGLGLGGLALANLGATGAVSTAATINAGKAAVGAQTIGNVEAISAASTGIKAGIMKWSLGGALKLAGLGAGVVIADIFTEPLRKSLNRYDAAVALADNVATASVKEGNSILDLVKVNAMDPEIALSNLARLDTLINQQEEALQFASIYSNDVKFNPSLLLVQQAKLRSARNDMNYIRSRVLKQASGIDDENTYAELMKRLNQ